MPGPLKNPRHERFAQELAKGRSAIEAYVAAGYQANEGNAGRLNRNEQVQARVAELVGKGAERAIATVERTVAELVRLGFSDISKVMRWGMREMIVGYTVTGKRCEIDDEACVRTETEIIPYAEPIDSDELPDDVTAAISEVQITKEGALKFKMHDKNAALEKLGKYLRMFVDRQEHSGPGGGPIATTSLDLSALPAEDRDALRAILSRRAG